MYLHRGRGQRKRQAYPRQVKAASRITSGERLWKDKPRHHVCRRGTIRYSLRTGACGQHVGDKCRAGPSFTERRFARRSTITHFESETTTGRNACDATIPFRSLKVDAVVPIKVDVANVQPQNNRLLQAPRLWLSSRHLSPQYQYRSNARSCRRSIKSRERSHQANPSTNKCTPSPTRSLTYLHRCRAWTPPGSPMSPERRSSSAARVKGHKRM